MCPLKINEKLHPPYPQRFLLNMSTFLTFSETLPTSLFPKLRRE